MAWRDWLNPTPTFPRYTGPYKVGSAHVEIPTTELEHPSSAPPGAASTVAFRIFYPCQPDSEQSGVRWVPDPQREYIKAYAEFLGANSAFAQVFAFVPRLLYYVSIPVARNAHLLDPPTTNKKWPVVVFSHGLGGSMNAYSHILGSLSSHGVVVVAPDHRDGSSPVSFVREPVGKKLHRVGYRRLPHKASSEVYEGRDEQLRIRLFELGLIHDALLKIDNGESVTNLHRKDTLDLSVFAHQLDVHRPGSITWAGHSFGAASVVQLVKSTFYNTPDMPEQSYRPLFNPNVSSSIKQQVTSSSTVVLLDLWTLPLQSPATAWLYKKPMPSYRSAEGGEKLLAILSEAFYKWSANLRETIRTVAKPPGSSLPDPHIFYPISSAHLSQSDFGILLPWITTKIFGAKDPERVLKLNTRAILQVMRNNGIQVANTSPADRELEENAPDEPQDLEILSTQKGIVRDWISLTAEIPTGEGRTEKGPSDAVVEGEVLGEVVQESER